jgi:hypothetical protein
MVAENRIVKVWDDSIIVFHKNKILKFKEEVDSLKEEIEVTAEEFMIEYAGTIHSIILATSILTSVDKKD